MPTTFTNFRESILSALYQEQIHEGRDEMISFRDLAEEYGLEWRSGWLEELQNELRSEGFLRGPSNGIGDDMAIGKLSGAGLRYIEEKYGTLKGVPTLISKPGRDEEPRLPTGFSKATGSIYIGEDDPPPGFGKDGDIFLQMAPAADRVVPLNHNLPEHRQIADGLAEIKEAIRGLNEPNVELEERDRVLASLEAARSLWDATQLKTLQLKVGVLMAAEDAAAMLASTAKAVAAALLVDAIKAFMKSHIGIDLDHI